MSVLMPEGV